jgi:hypothetical protein
MPSNMKTILDEAVKIAFLKPVLLTAGYFLHFVMKWEVITSTYYCTQIRWLSRGKVLTRLFELRDKVRLFLISSKLELTHYLNDFIWLSSLAYYADIFNILSTLNSSL